MTLLPPIALAGLCAGLGVWLLRESGQGARIGGIGLWVTAAGPAFYALDAAGLAPGSGPGALRLAAVAGWPMIAVAWALTPLDEQLVQRLRPFAFVVLLLVAMLDPTQGGLLRPLAAGALGVQGVAAARAALAGARVPGALGLVGALLPTPLLHPEAPPWGLALWTAGLVFSAAGLRGYGRHLVPEGSS